MKPSMEQKIERNLSKSHELSTRYRNKHFLSDRLSDCLYFIDSGRSRTFVPFDVALQTPPKQTRESLIVVPDSDSRLAGFVQEVKKRISSQNASPSSFLNIEDQYRLLIRLISRFYGDVTPDLQIRSKKSIQSLKKKKGRNALYLGEIRVGLSRHRATMFKYLCDICNFPCVLVRGDFQGVSRVWNLIRLPRLLNKKNADTKTKQKKKKTKKKKSFLWSGFGQKSPPKRSSLGNWKKSSEETNNDVDNKIVKNVKNDDPFLALSPFRRKLHSSPSGKPQRSLSQPNLLLMNNKEADFGWKEVIIDFMILEENERIVDSNNSSLYRPLSSNVQSLDNMSSSSSKKKRKPQSLPLSPPSDDGTDLFLGGGMNSTYSEIRIDQQKRSSSLRHFKNKSKSSSSSSPLSKISSTSSSKQKRGGNSLDNLIEDIEDEDVDVNEEVTERIEKLVLESGDFLGTEAWGETTPQDDSGIVSPSNIVSMLNPLDVRTHEVIPPPPQRINNTKKKKTKSSKSKLDDDHQKSGNWTCSSCGYSSNSSYVEKCRRCKKKKTGWYCVQCNFMNSSDKNECSICLLSKKKRNTISNVQDDDDNDENMNLNSNLDISNDSVESNMDKMDPKTNPEDQLLGMTDDPFIRHEIIQQKKKKQILEKMKTLERRSSMKEEKKRKKSSAKTSPRKISKIKKLRTSSTSSSCSSSDDDNDDNELKDMNKKSKKLKHKKTKKSKKKKLERSEENEDEDDSYEEERENFKEEESEDDDDNNKNDNNKTNSNIGLSIGFSNGWMKLRWSDHHRVVLIELVGKVKMMVYEEEGIIFEGVLKLESSDIIWKMKKNIEKELKTKVQVISL